VRDLKYPLGLPLQLPEDYLAHGQLLVVETVQAAATPDLLNGIIAGRGIAIEVQHRDARAFYDCCILACRVYLKVNEIGKISRQFSS